LNLALAKGKFFEIILAKKIKFWQSNNFARLPKEKNINFPLNHNLAI